MGNADPQNTDIMKQADEITLKAFLIALEQLEEPLPEAEQTELKEIAENINNNLGKLDAIAENNPKLDKLYQEIRSSLQNEYTKRNKSSVIAIDRTPEHLAFIHNFSYESQKILNMDGIQLSRMFKDFIIKRHLETNYQLRNPLEKDSECLIGLSRDELEALAESILSVSKQAQLDDLLARNSEAQLSPQETVSLERLLAQVDQLMILKTRARYTLKKLDTLLTAS
jgi:hypothetical protein